MEQASDVVYLLSHDSRVREDISTFLTARNMDFVGFGCTAEYLAHSRSDRPACLIVEMELPDICDLDLQVPGNESCPSIIFISSWVDIPGAVRAMRAGAVDVLKKPLEPERLLSSIGAALLENRFVRQQDARLASLRKRLSTLTPREREVLPLVVGGLLNKQAAAMLGISEVTLQVHRGQIMRKMAAESFADLVRMAEKLCIPHWREPKSCETLSNSLDAAHRFPKYSAALALYARAGSEPAGFLKGRKSV